MMFEYGSSGHNVLEAKLLYMYVSSL